MIVKIGDNDGLVLGVSSNNIWYCIENCMLPLRRFLVEEVQLLDSRIPNNWVITVDYFEEPSNRAFFFHPASITVSHLLDLSVLHESEEMINSFEYYELQNAVNDLREFHGLPMLDIPYVEEYEYELMTPEERRQKAIDDELEEYLRIGEQIQKEKNR